MDEHDKMKAAIDTLEAHKEDFKDWRKRMGQAADAGEPLPAPPPSIAGAVATVGNTLGNVALGVGSTAADAVGVVGGTAQALHDNVNSFFSNLRTRLGI